MVELRRAAAGGRHKKATPDIFSHEFVIQNHGDIMSCVLMVFLVGLIFPATSHIAALFIAPQYNETRTINATTETGPTSIDVSIYRSGIHDLFTIGFYTVAWIVGHAVIQEYALDKVLRKVHLSKIKTFKFNDSGHQFLFAVYSIIHAGYVISEFIQHQSDIRKIWTGYPTEQRWMSLNAKLFFIFQISFWLHHIPEFYFQKYKKDEMRHKGLVSLFHVFFISLGYFMNFSRITVVLLLLEYVPQALFHLGRIVHFAEKKSIASNVFKVYNIVFVLARLATITLTVSTFWNSLPDSNAVAAIDIAAGNYNTSNVRVNIMLFIFSLQLYQTWNFLTFHFLRIKDASQRSKSKSEKKPAAQVKPKKRRDESASESESAETKKKN